MFLADDLYGSWPLNGDALDNSGRANDLTNNGSVTFAAGKIGQAASFSGSSAQALSRVGTDDLQVGDIDFTAACWVNFSSLAASQALMSKLTTVGNQRSWRFTYNLAANRFQAQVSHDGLGVFTTLTASNPGAPTIGAWFLVIFWHDAANNVIGLQVGNASQLFSEETAAHTTGVFAGSARFVVGATDGATFQTPVSGLIDTPLWWRRVLTSQERTDLWNSGTGFEYPFGTPLDDSLPMTTHSLFQSRAASSLLARRSTVSLFPRRETVKV